MIAISTALVVAACEQTTPPPTEVPTRTPPSQVTSSPRTSARGSQVAVHARTVDGYMDSAISGMLTVVDGCVVIKTSNGRLVTPIFVASDVDWDGATLTLLASGRKLRLEAEVRLGGGPASAKGEALPPGCPPAAWAAGPN
jgi:hypothetical protein